jgi:hypothetical protein
MARSLHTGVIAGEYESLISGAVGAVANRAEFMQEPRTRRWHLMYGWCPATHRRLQGSKDTIRESGGSSTREERPSRCKGSHHATSLRSRRQLSRTRTAARISLCTDHDPIRPGYYPIRAKHDASDREVGVLAWRRPDSVRSEYARAGNQCADGGQPHTLVAIRK